MVIRVFSHYSGARITLLDQIESYTYRCVNGIHNLKGQYSRTVVGYPRLSWRWTGSYCGS
jgi:hypothetical protein